MSNEIAKYGENLNFDDMQRIGSALAASGYFETAKEHKMAVAQMVTKIMAGAEMGFPPFASVQGVHIIKGRPTLSANLMAAAVKAHPRYDYRVREMTDAKVVIEFFELGESLGVSEFTKTDLERAESGGLIAPGAKKSMKERFPRNMLFARAMSNGVRWYTPDLFAGSAVYVSGELGEEADDDSAIDGAYRVSEPQPALTAEVSAQEAADENFYDGEASDTPVVDDAPEPPKITPAQLKKLHAVGTDFYGKEWDAKRPLLVQSVTDGDEMSASELTIEQAKRLIDGIEKRINKRDAEPVAEAA